MKKERKILLALLLIFVCGLAFFVFAMFGGVFGAPLAVRSNGEEIKPYENRLSLSVSSNQKQYESECEWLQDAEIKQSIPELTYADDFSIKGKNADKYTYVLNVYNPRGKCVQKEIELSMLPELQAGIYYIGIVRQDKNGEYVEEPALFQNEICEYVFKMRKPSRAAEGEPRVTIVSNGEEIKPFSEALSSSRWVSAGTWDAAKLIQRWPRDKSVVSEFPVVTYAEDFEIRVRDDTSLYGAFKVYNSDFKEIQNSLNKSQLAQFSAGTYYVCFNISYHSGDWMVSKHGDEGYEYSGSSQCLFTLIKEDEKEETEKNEKEDGDAVSREVPIVSQNGKQIPITHSYFLHASSYSNGHWIAADGMPIWMVFSPEENNFEEIEYSDDVEIVYEGEVISNSRLNVYDSEMKHYASNVNLTYIEALPAGIYYIGIPISTRGEYIDDEKYPGYESSTSEYVFKLVKTADAAKEEELVVEQKPLVWVYSNGAKVIPYADTYFMFSKDGYSRLIGGSEQLPADFPEIEYAEDFVLEYAEGVSLASMVIYNTELRAKYEFGSGASLASMADLPNDTYYLGILVSQEGDDSANRCEYFVRMIKPDEPEQEISKPDIEPDPEPDTAQVDHSNTISFSAPMYVYSYEELEQAISESYGRDTYVVHQLEHYYIPTYASKWCELSQIYSGNPMSYTVRYSMKEEFGERNSYAEPWDLTMTITVDEKAAIESFQFFTTQASFKPYEACEGVYYSSYTHSGSEEVIQFLWMKDGCLFFMNIYSALLHNIRENDPEALESTVFELERVELDPVAIKKGTAVLPDHGIAAAKEQAKENKTAFWYEYDLEELTHYYIPVYAKNNCELTISVFYGGSDGVIYSTYDYAETPKPDMALEFDRETNCGEEYLETAIRRYNLQPYEDCEGVYYVAYPSSSTYFFWLHEGHAFMLSVLPEFMEYLKANKPEALNGALFELEKVELE